MLSTVIREKLNLGLGQAIKGPDFKANIIAPEAEGGLTDTMEDRGLIATALRQLIDQAPAF